MAAAWQNSPDFIPTAETGQRAARYFPMRLSAAIVRIPADNPKNCTGTRGFGIFLFAKADPSVADVVDKSRYPWHSVAHALCRAIIRS